MARRFGSAMISNTDSMLSVYAIKHIRVKAYLMVAEKGTLLSAEKIRLTHTHHMAPRLRLVADDAPAL